MAQVETAIDSLGYRAPHQNYVLVQNCFRHFDVEKIGRSQLHLSLFEMPGAFSFGPNQRQVTVRRMWELLTGEIGLPQGRLWASYFAGGVVSGHFFAADRETRQAWQAVGLPPERIVGLGPEHNFWKQGGGIDGQESSRKCGPNTELFFDRGAHLKCGSTCRPGCTCGRFVEFANSLFIFAEIDAETNALAMMPEPFTETVIGVERIAMILAGRSTVFEIETIQPLLERLRSFYAPQSRPAFLQTTQSERIVVDHGRALLYLAADGAPPPGKGGRRRLMRILMRRVLAQLRILEVDSTRCLTVLTELIVSLDRGDQPQLSEGRQTLLNYFEEETATFERTLARGYQHLDRLLARTNGRGLEGRQLVNLVKQFGLPVSLLKVTLARRGFEFRESEYRAAMERWRQNLGAASSTNR